MAELTVVTQNILLDYRRTREKLILPQSERIGSIAATLSAFDRPLNVVGIQEAQKTKEGHNGERLAERLGFDNSFWFNHNQKTHSGASVGRSNEYMGVFGTLVDSAEMIELGDNRRAVITIIAGVAVANVHLRSGAGARHTRQSEMSALLAELASYEDAVIMGDLNEPPLPLYALARKELKNHGFRSVFPLTDQSYPRTSPIRPYIPAAVDGRGWQGNFVKRSWSIDDIQVRGARIEALAAGVLQRVVDTTIHNPYNAPLDGSDHDGVWATLRIDD